MDDNLLVSLAVLKANKDSDEDRNYFDLFVPFVVESIRTCFEDIVAVEELQSDLQKRFGFFLPIYVLNILLRRIRSKTDYITVKYKEYHVKRDKIKNFSFPVIRDQFLAQNRELVFSLQLYCNKEYQLSWNENEAQKALEAFIKTRQVAIIRAVARENEIEIVETLDDRERYYVANYINQIIRTKSPQLEFLETVLQGIMLSGVIFFDTSSYYDTNPIPTVFYFDCMFICYSLGYLGKAYKDPCQELLTLLKDAGARLACFQHTIDEIKAILQACAKRMRLNQPEDDSYDPSLLTAAKAEHLEPSDLDLRAIQLEKKLEELGIAIEQLPPYDNQYVVDEEKLAEEIGNRFYHDDFKKKKIDSKRLKRDVDSLSAIARLRKGISTSDIETCGSVFVTTNDELANLSATFFNIRDREIAPCLTDFMLTCLLWFRNPTQAPDIALKYLGADCYAALQPSPSLWQHYVQELDKALEDGDISKETYVSLRYLYSAPSALMEVSHGDEEVITRGSILEVQERIKAAIAEEMVEEIDKLKREVKIWRKGYEMRKDIFCRRISRALVVVKWGFFFLMAACVILSWFPQIITCLVMWQRIAISLIAGAFSIYDLVNIFTDKGLAKRERIWIERGVKRRFKDESPDCFSMDDIDTK